MHWWYVSSGGFTSLGDSLQVYLSSRRWLTRKSMWHTTRDPFFPLPHDKECSVKTSWRPSMVLHWSLTWPTWYWLPARLLHCVLFSVKVCQIYLRGNKCITIKAKVLFLSIPFFLFLVKMMNPQFPLGIQAATCARVGNALGAGDTKRAILTCKMSLCLSSQLQTHPVIWKKKICWKG